MFRNFFLVLIGLISWNSFAQVTDSITCYLVGHGHPQTAYVGTVICEEVIKRGGRQMSVATVEGINAGINNKSTEVLGVLRGEISSLKSELQQATSTEIQKLNTELTAVRDSIGETSVKLPELIINDPRFRALIEEAVRKAFNGQK